jgi:hypothetical protein
MCVFPSGFGSFIVLARSTPESIREQRLHLEFLRVKSIAALFELLSIHYQLH